MPHEDVVGYFNLQQKSLCNTEETLMLEEVSSVQMMVSLETGNTLYCGITIHGVKKKHFQDFI